MMLPHRVPTAVSSARRHVSKGVLGFRDTSFWLEPNADRKYTSIFWGEHLFDQNMVGSNTTWTNPMPSSVPDETDFGIEGKPRFDPPGAYAGVNRPWSGHKPSRVQAGYYGSGMALRDSWGPDAETRVHGGQARPEVLLETVSVDYFLDEFSVPLNDQNTIMESCRAKHTSNLRINLPQVDNVLDANTAKTLFYSVWQSTHALHRRITMLGACQNGKTEWWCKGLPLDFYASELRWLVDPPDSPSALETTDAAAQIEQLASGMLHTRKTPNEDVERKELAVIGALHGTPGLQEGAAGRLLRQAYRQALWINNQEALYPQKSDDDAPKARLASPDAVHAIADSVRWAMKAVWMLPRGDSPTLSFVNGRAHNIGAGLALLANHAALRYEAEITFSGAATGTTPIGGLLRLLRDDVVELKYPGLAEYVTLTGDALYYGDAKRLGWTAVHAPTDVHLNERMLHDYMNMHGPHDGGNATRILHSALFNDTDQDPEMDRCSFTVAKARWVEEAFHEKPSVAAIKDALKAIIAKEVGDQQPEAEVLSVVSSEGSKVLREKSITKGAWAQYVLGLLDRYSPRALAVTLEMVRHAREERLNLAECMSLEFRCFMRMLMKPDFIRAQVCCGGFKDPVWPAANRDWDDAAGCPEWSPRTDDAVSQEEVRWIVCEPLDWLRDGTAELDLEVEAMDSGAVKTAVKHKGIELVDNLGEDPAQAAADNAHLPSGINVYRVARHPQTGVIGSDREPAVKEEQLRYRKQILKEADVRIASGATRVFDPETSVSTGMQEFQETPRETKERLGKLRWDEGRLRVEHLANPATAVYLRSRIDVGGEAVLSPDGLRRHSVPFSPRNETSYGDIPDYNESTLTHFYDPKSGLPPKPVRSWDALERYHAMQLKQGKPAEQISQMILQHDF
ncbi:Enoyl-CoA hydratase/isomerase family [Diplonema papillatum]|nr:Enoyl-CoA hydratase/isomerase family [Diplonema papillatum]